ncbi:chloride channel protein [Deinococcus lacus]|uniref:Chloride channel protein n=1 Tax=Deinococcus lacus TaxID=392561 RepID=A0ABW1YAG1_9DEIO
MKRRRAWPPALQDFPPGTPGEGGLMMAFGSPEPWGLLLLPAAGAAYAALVPRGGDPLGRLIQVGLRQSGPPGWGESFRVLGAATLAQSSGLLVGRDAPFTVLGELGAGLVQAATHLDSGERRTLALAGAAAALGAVLHAPLAAAVLVAEVLYRRFEFEYEVLMSCVLAAVTAYAVYGLAFGFAPCSRSAAKPTWALAWPCLACQRQPSSFWPQRLVPGLRCGHHACGRQPGLKVGGAWLSARCSVPRLPPWSLGPALPCWATVLAGCSWASATS